MSNFGQGALAVVGGIIGFYVAGPTGAAYGFQLGLAVGTVVSPTQLPGTYGPRLTDNRTTTSQVGAPVIEVFGTDVTAGTVIYAGKIVETENTQSAGGKGGPEQNITTYTYTQTIAVGLCRGPMQGVRRIWENGKVVYDRRPQQEGESYETYQNRIAVSAGYETGTPGIEILGVVIEPTGGFELYLGTEDQMPDPTIELDKGVGRTPAFRGLMYIVFPNRRLREDQALRHPNFKFEVYDEGTRSCEIVEFLATDYLAPWGTDTLDIRNPIGSYVYDVPFESETIYGTLSEAVAVLEDEHPALQSLQAWSLAGNPKNEHGPWENVDPTMFRQVYYYYPIHTFSGEVGEESNICDIAVPGGRWGLNTASGSVPAKSGVYARPFEPNWSQVFSCVSPNDTVAFYDAYLRITRLPTPPPDPCLIYPPAPIPGYAIIDGFYVECGPWVTESGSFLALQRYSALGETIVSFPREPVISVDSPLNTEAFWVAQYNAAVAQGLMAPGLDYGSDYPDLLSEAYRRSANVCSIESVGISIATIVRRICNRCGLADSDIDVSDLEDRYVEGYSLARIMDGRSAIAPLRSVGFFDCVESGGVLKFPVRGKASVRTLTVEDLGAHEFGSEAPAIVTTKQMQDVELPRQLFVQYRDPARDYEQSEQPSPTRLITEAVNDVYVDVAVAISAEQAARAAEILWADMWASRWQHEIAVDSAQADLEPTDCFVIPIDGRNERVRAMTVDDSAVILRKFTLVRDDDGNYVSDAIAEAPQIPPSSITVYSAPEVFVLDIPPLRVEDNDAGVYIAVRPTNAGATFSGAQLFRSVDGGTSWETMAAVIGTATTGTLDAPFPPGETTVWDDVTEIFVTLESGTLESKTDDLVLAGANVLAIGDNVRYEIVQFANAELIAPDQWKLTRLLRGRRGTEHNMGTQLSGDNVVLLTGSGIARMPITNAYLNQPVVIRAVTLGTSFSTGVDSTYSSTGEALRPFSPVQIAAERDTSGDVLITWIRRDRLGAELPDGSEIAMSDPPESYAIEILDGASPSAVVRTLTSSTESVVYSSADQATDFGSPPPDTLAVIVYQISAVRGRGTGGEASVEITGV